MRFSRTCRCELEGSHVYRRVMSQVRRRIYILSGFRPSLDVVLSLDGKGFLRVHGEKVN